MSLGGVIRRRIRRRLVGTRDFTQWRGKVQGSGILGPHRSASTCLLQLLIPSKGVRNDGGEVVVLRCPSEHPAGAIGSGDDPLQA